VYAKENIYLSDECVYNRASKSLVIPFIVDCRKSRPVGKDELVKPRRLVELLIGGVFIFAA
jgi:hypothetical protein